MRRQPPRTKEGDIIHKDGTYFQVWRGGRACQLSTDTLGYPHITSKVIGTPANYDRVTTWGSAVLGPAHSAFPAPEGWAIALDPNEETRLDEWRVQDSYRTYQTQNTTRPSCEVNWRRYFNFNIPMDEVYASIAKPGIFTPHHYMTFFKVIHRALPTNTRFGGNKLCRLGCGCTETFVHWFHCKHIYPIWRAMANILTALGCGVYNCNKELVFLTLKSRRNGGHRLINKHM